MLEDRQERRDRNRFRAEMVMMAVAIGTMMVNIWQSRVANQQYLSSEFHYKIERDERLDAEDRDQRPVLLPAIPAFGKELYGDEHDNDVTLIVANLGSSAALGSHLEWSINSNSASSDIKDNGPTSDDTICMPEGRLTFNYAPMKELADAAEANGGERAGILRIVSRNIFNHVVVTNQQFFASVIKNSDGRALLVKFGNRTFEAYFGDDHRRAKKRIQSRVPSLL